MQSLYPFFWGFFPHWRMARPRLRLFPDGIFFADNKKKTPLFRVNARARARRRDDRHAPPRPTALGARVPTPRRRPGGQKRPLGRHRRRGPSPRLFARASRRRDGLRRFGGASVRPVARLFHRRTGQRLLKPSLRDARAPSGAGRAVGAPPDQRRAAAAARDGPFGAGAPRLGRISDHARRGARTRTHTHDTLERALERLRQLDAPTVARPEAVQLAYERLAEAMCDAKRGASHRALRERADAFERTLDADDRAAMREATCRLERVLARQNALKGAIASGQAQQCTAHARSHQPARTRTHTHDTHDTHDTR